MPVMARIHSLLMAFVVLGGLLGCSPVDKPRIDDQSSLDRLFDRLVATSDDTEARMIEATIRHAWARSDRPEINQLMNQAIAAMHEGDFDTAIAALDQVVAQQPELVAGWNLRATVHYVQDDNAGALSDIAKTLALEPRHFGAWCGLGLIMLDIGDNQAALRAFEIALRYNPHLTDIKQDVVALRDQLAGLPI